MRLVSCPFVYTLICGGNFVEIKKQSYGRFNLYLRLRRGTDGVIHP